MFPVISGRIEPSAVDIDDSIFALESDPPIGLVEQPGAALALEIIDDVRKSVPLQDILLDQKRSRMDTPLSRGAFNVINTFLFDFAKISRPELPVFPFLDRPHKLRPTGKHFLSRAPFLDFKNIEGIALMAQDDGPFPGGDIVSDVVDKNFGTLGKADRSD